MSEIEEREPDGPAAGKVEAPGRLDARARAFIELSPLALVATVDAAGNQDLGLYGDLPGFAAIVDDATLAMPDALADGRRIVLADAQHDARIAVVFLLPGINEGLRIGGRARISIDAALLERLTRSGPPVASALVVEIDEVFAFGGDALSRARLWDEASKVDPSRLPGAGAEADKTIEADYLSGLY